MAELSNLIETSPLNSPSGEEKVCKTVFFNRKPFDSKRKKPKPIIYLIYICSRCKPMEGSSLDAGAWCALIVKQPQDTFNESKENRTTYMVSGVEEPGNHIRIRLKGVKESLEWITANMDNSQYESVEATLVSNDVFVVNTLREWIPKWARNEFKMDIKSAELRPNHDLLVDIARITTKIKLTVKWQVERSNEMATLSEKVAKMLSSL